MSKSLSSKSTQPQYFFDRCDLVTVSATALLPEVLIMMGRSPLLIQGIPWYGVAVYHHKRYCGWLTLPMVLATQLTRPDWQTCTAQELLYIQEETVTVEQLQDPGSLYGVLESLHRQQSPWISVLGAGGQWQGISHRWLLQEIFWQPELLAMRPVTEVMTTQVTGLAPNTSLTYVVQVLREEKLPCVLITADEQGQGGAGLPWGKFWRHSRKKEI